jgi:hypothetical protein
MKWKGCGRKRSWPDFKALSYTDPFVIYKPFILSSYSLNYLTFPSPFGSKINHSVLPQMTHAHTFGYDNSH